MAVMDFSAVFEILGDGGDYTLTRRVPGTIDQDTGLIAAPTETDVALTGVIVEPEPSLADDEQRARPGAWSTDRLMVWVPKSQLEDSGGALTASGSDRLADRITYGGRLYEVTDSLDWSDRAGYSQARFGIVEPAVES